MEANVKETQKWFVIAPPCITGPTHLSYELESPSLLPREAFLLPLPFLL